MTQSVVTVKRQVEDLKQVIMPKRRGNRDLVLIMFCGSSIDPHGKYGVWKLHVFQEHWPTPHSGFDVVSEAEEVNVLRSQWETDEHKLHKKTVSFEEFLEGHRCECPIHKKVSIGETE